MSSLVTEDWESGKVHLADSGDMVRSKQERFVANLLTSESISFEYERELSSWDGEVDQKWTPMLTPVEH